MNKKVIIIVSVLAILLVVGVGAFLFTGKKESSGFNKNIQNENKKKGTGSTNLDSSKVLVVYFSETGNTQTLAKLISDEVGGDLWLTQKAIGELFNTTRNNITMHLQDIFSKYELDEKSTSKDCLLVQKESYW